MPESSTEMHKTTTPGAGHIGQTLLVGENVYIRPIEEDDAKYGMSWMDTIFQNRLNALKNGSMRT